jgi:hypothetical protein
VEWTNPAVLWYLFDHPLTIDQISFCIQQGGYFMVKHIGTVLALALVFGLNGMVRAEDTKDATPVLDKAIKALS